MEGRDELLALLRENARYSTTELARLADMDQERVEEEIAALEATGALRGYQAVVDWSELDRERVRATVELNVTLDRETSYGDIADRIVKYPEVTTLRLMS
ncbi:MAG: Lrp/AsnC family transcriptional regulator, partial [Halorhabdus sp.]